MCGIVGYVGARNATPIIYDGLKRLEYRGYDSAGIAVIQDGHIEVRRDAGKLDNLRSLLDTQPIDGAIGIGHTRWATHGAANQTNAHPHLDCTGDLVVIHNGIVENFLELRSELQAKGHTFKSETDTETIVHLVERGTERVEPVVPRTIARSIAIGNPADGPRAACAIRETGGWAAAVSDAELVQGIRLLAEEAGVFTETAGGVPVAAALALARAGRLGPDDEVVLCITGNGLTTVEVVEDVLSGAPIIAP